MKTADKISVIATTIFFCLMGATFLGIALFNFIPTHNFVKSAASTHGVVIELKRTKYKSIKNTNRRLTYTPIIKFKTPNGKNIQFESRTSSNPPEFSVGQMVPVLYNRSYPQEAKVDSFVQLWVLPMFFSGFGIVFMGAGATQILIPILVNKKQK